LARAVFRFSSGLTSISAQPPSHTRFCLLALPGPDAPGGRRRGVRLDGGTHPLSAAGVPGGSGACTRRTL